MKKKFAGIMMSAFAISQSLYADESLKHQIERLKQLLNQQQAPELSVNGNFSKFRFRSNSGAQYNRYDGENKSVTLGEVNHTIGPRVQLGASVFIANVQSEGRTLLTGVNPNGFSQTTDSLGVNGNITYQLKTKQPIFITAFANYATNHTRTVSIINAGMSSETSGRATYGGSNTSAGLSVNSLYQKGRWQWTGFARYFIFASYQEGYTVNINGVNSNNPSLTMSQHNFSETLQVRYQLKKNVSPFALVTLTQGVDRRYSRNISVASLSSSVNAPRFQTALNGAQVGGGLAIQYKQVSITPSYRYQMQGKEFQSHNFDVQLLMKLY